MAGVMAEFKVQAVRTDDGKVGVTAQFETEEELNQFKQAVAVLRIP